MTTGNRRKENATPGRPLFAAVRGRLSFDSLSQAAAQDGAVVLETSVQVITSMLGVSG